MKKIWRNWTKAWNFDELVKCTKFFKVNLTRTSHFDYLSVIITKAWNGNLFDPCTYKHLYSILLLLLYLSLLSSSKPRIINLHTPQFCSMNTASAFGIMLSSSYTKYFLSPSMYISLQLPLSLSLSLFLLISSEFLKSHFIFLMSSLFLCSSYNFSEFQLSLSHTRILSHSLQFSVLISFLCLNTLK